MRPLLPQYHVYRRRKDCILKKSSGPLQFTKWILSSKNISGVHHHCVYRFSCLETLNPNWYEGWYFYLLVIFGSVFVSWILIKNFQTFLEVKIYIDRVSLKPCQAHWVLGGPKVEHFPYFHSSCQLELMIKFFTTFLAEIPFCFLFSPVLFCLMNSAPASFQPDTEICHIVDHFRD